MCTELETKVNNLFSTINFQNENMFLDVQLNSYGLYVSVKETKERWSNEIVKISFSSNYGEKDPTIDFNHGSGGWNAGNPIVQLGIMQEAFTAAKIVVQIMEENKNTILELMKEYQNIIRQQFLCSR